MSEALYIGHDGSLVCVVCFEIRPTLLGVVADIGEVLCCVTRQRVPCIEGVLPLLCNFSAILTVLIGVKVVKGNLCQLFVQLLQCLPQKWQVALAQRSTPCDCPRLLIEKSFDGDSLGCGLVEQRGRAKTGDRGSPAGVIGNGQVAPFPQRRKVTLALLKRVFGVEGLAYCITHLLVGELIAIRTVALEEEAHNSAIPTHAIRHGEVTEDGDTSRQIEG